MYFESSELTPEQAQAMATHMQTMGLEPAISEGDGHTYVSTNDIKEVEQVLALTTLENHLTSPFIWKTRDNQYFSVKEMNTMHMFHTLVMIWNHSVPEPYKFRSFKEYVFGPHYSNEYMAQAVGAMLLELSQRDDLPGPQQFKLAKIIKMAQSLYDQKEIPSC